MKKSKIINKCLFGLGAVGIITPTCLTITGCNSSSDKPSTIDMNLQIDVDSTVYHNSLSSEVVAHVSEISGIEGITYKWECQNSPIGDDLISIANDGTITAINNSSFNGLFTYKIWGLKDGSKSKNEVYLNLSWQPIINGIVYQYNDDNKYDAKALNTSSVSGNVVINSTVNGISVESVTENGFSFCENISSLEIEDLHGGEIEDNAFLSCTNLSSATLNGAAIIGNSAFAGCTNLESITFSNEMLYTIGESAFEGCTNLSNINLSGCINLSKLDKGAFLGCSAESIVLPSSVTYIGEGCFGNNANLSSITFENAEPSTWLYPSTPCWFYDINTILTTIYVPQGQVENYQNALQATSWWSNWSSQITVQEITE